MAESPQHGNAVPTAGVDVTAATAADSPRPAPGAADPDSPQKLGNYTILRLIGSGGMGAVYEAQQDNPRRTVALKVMRSAISSPAALRRFEYEAQLLARLRHPGIAQVYEAGMHMGPPSVAGGPPEPIPYYAMEYIPDARTLTDYARARRLTVAERLELFAKVCDAVQHGHAKGIIHRDLKPANILVDAGGEPKIIDFGVARAGDPAESGGGGIEASAAHTLPGVLIGTLQYMSPEQVAADPAAIDTRSDVYALGVVLYELLSGRPPYDLSHASIHDAVQKIREEPATRLSTATTVGGGGATGPGTGSTAGLRGDVETIVMKALEKGPERRYQSAADLASDIRRFLNREPITARPASMTYQLRVIARKHKAVAAAALVAVSSLVAGAVVSARYGVSEKQQRAEAVAAREKAEKQLARATRVTDFLKEMLATADPHNARGSQPTVRDLLDIASSKIPAVFKDDPVTGAEVRITLGQTYFHLSELDKALAEFRAAHEVWKGELGADNPETLNALALSGAALLMQGKLPQAEEALRQALDVQKRVVGPDHADTLATMGNLALVLQDQNKLADSEKLQREVLSAKQRTLGPVHPETVTTLNNLADLLQSQGRVDEAVKLSRETMDSAVAKLGSRHPDALMARAIYTSALFDASKYQEAEPMLKQLLSDRVQVLGTKHLDTITTTNTLGLVEEGLGKYDEAVKLLREAARMGAEHLGPEHPSTLTYRNNLANALSRGAKKLPDEGAALDESEGIFKDLIEVRKRISGPASTDTLTVQNNYALLLEERNKFAEAEPMFREVVAGVDAALPENHWMRSAARKNLADCLVDLGQYEEAEGLLKPAYEHSTKAVGKDHQRTRAIAKSLERLYTRLNRPDEAAKWTPLASAGAAPTAPAAPTASGEKAP